MKQIVEALLKQIWRAILRDKLDEEGPSFLTVWRALAGVWETAATTYAEGPSFPTVLRSAGPPRDVVVMSTHERVLTFSGETSKSLAEKVTHICNSVANNLRKGDMAQQLRREVGDMKRASDELREMLNPVKLRPMILRTRCDLCPA